MNYNRANYPNWNAIKDDKTKKQEYVKLLLGKYTKHGETILKDFLRLKYILMYIELSDERGLYNIHTRGLVENYNHIELQIVAPFNQNIANMLIKTCVDNIKTGKRYNEGDIVYNEICDKLNVTFVNRETQSHGQILKVLRIIFPDKMGQIDKNVISYPYKYQYDD